MKSFVYDYLRIRIQQQFAGLSRSVRRLFGRRQVQKAVCHKSVVLHTARVHQLILVGAISSSMVLSGCSMNRKKQPGELQYWDGDKPITSYRDYNTSIEHAAIDNLTAHAVQISGEPRNLQRNVDDEVREVTLHEMMLTALSHNEIIETTALGGVGSKAVLTNPAGVASVYDSAIQETGILFGRRGLDAALSDFDTRLNSSLTFNGGTNRQNTPAFGPTPALAPIDTQLGIFNTGLSKSFATGGSVEVNSNWSNAFSNSPQSYYQSAYSGVLGATFTQPLLAGSGVDFTRVAGPTNPAFGSIAGVSQGVSIARINQDLSLADFEIAVRTALRDIENSYWDLYLAYQKYDVSITAHESAFELLRISMVREEVGTGKKGDEPLARDRFYETQANVELALNKLYQAESELRRLVGLPVNDGTVLRPAEEPILAELKPDWQACLVDALTQRVELRRQKWQVKSLQLQLDAARSLVRPSLNAVAGYNRLGFGDTLGGQGVYDPVLGTPTNSALGSMTHDNLNSWTVGMQFSVPIGLRQARSQVRNYELQVAKANAVLAAQELSIAHDVATAIQDVAATYAAAQSSHKRRLASLARLDVFKAQLGETAIADVVVRAQESHANAGNSYFEQVVAYNKAITSLNLATGRLLEFNNIYLQEGKWCPEAYDDAMLRAKARTHGIDDPSLGTQPAEFVTGAPAGYVELQTPQFDYDQEVVPEPEVAPDDESASIRQ